MPDLDACHMPNDGEVRCTWPKIRRGRGGRGSSRRQIGPGSAPMHLQHHSTLRHCFPWRQAAIIKCLNHSVPVDSGCLHQPYFWAHTLLGTCTSQDISGLHGLRQHVTPQCCVKVMYLVRDIWRGVSSHTLGMQQPGLHRGRNRSTANLVLTRSVCCLPEMEVHDRQNTV